MGSGFLAKITNRDKVKTKICVFHKVSSCSKAKWLSLLPVLEYVQESVDTPS